MNPDDFTLFSQWKMQQQQQYSTFSQQQQNQNPDSTNARRNRLRVTEEDPEHFGPDALPRPDGMYRIQKSQRSSNSTASSGSNPGMFQEMLQQQYELERKMKQDVLERESRARVDLLESQKIAEDMRVLTMDTSSLDPMNAAIIMTLVVEAVLGSDGGGEACIITDIKYVLTQKNFDALCRKFHIPEEVHPQLPTPDQTIHDKPEGKIEGSPVCYTKPIESLKNWNNRFFWVDSFTCLALFRWPTNKSVPKDPLPKPTDFNAEHYATLVAHPAPFRKFPKVFLSLVGISRYYPFDEETYPSFRDENDEVMDLSAFVNVADPTLVKVVERKRVEGEAKLLETIVGRTVPLLPVAPVRSEASLEDSVNRLFDEGGSGNQVDSAIGIDQNILVKPEVEHVAAETEIVKKSPSVIRKLLASSILNAEVGVTAIPTLPFVTSSVSAMPEKDGDDFTDAVTVPNLRTIGPSVRFVISPDSSHHSSTKATEAEVESIHRSADPPIMTEAVVTTEAAGVSSHLFPKTVVDNSSRFGPDLFLDSDSADTERPVTASTTQRPSKELSMGS
ncbi:hypothetical protein Tco_0577546 [Tanacetum coccineum]